MMVMIDLGATYNFISLDVVNELRVKVTDFSMFGVSLGNSEAVKGIGVCNGVLLRLDGGMEVLEYFSVGFGQF